MKAALLKTIGSLSRQIDTRDNLISKLEAHNAQLVEAVEYHLLTWKKGTYPNLEKSIANHDPSWLEGKIAEGKDDSKTWKKAVGWLYNVRNDSSLTLDECINKFEEFSTTPKAKEAIDG